MTASCEDLLADLTLARAGVDEAAPEDRCKAVDALHRAVRRAQGVVPLLTLAEFLNGYSGEKD